MSRQLDDYQSGHLMVFMLLPRCSLAIGQPFPWTFWDHLEITLRLSQGGCSLITQYKSSFANTKHIEIARFISQSSYNNLRKSQIIAGWLWDIRTGWKLWDQSQNCNVGSQDTEASCDGGNWLAPPWVVARHCSCLKIILRFYPLYGLLPHPSALVTDLWLHHYRS